MKAAEERYIGKAKGRAGEERERERKDQNDKLCVVIVLLTIDPASVVLDNYFPQQYDSDEPE